MSRSDRDRSVTFPSARIARQRSPSNLCSTSQPSSKSRRSLSVASIGFTNRGASGFSLSRASGERPESVSGSDRPIAPHGTAAARGQTASPLRRSRSAAKRPACLDGEGPLGGWSGARRRERAHLEGVRALLEVLVCLRRPADREVGLALFVLVPALSY